MLTSSIPDTPETRAIIAMAVFVLFYLALVLYFFVGFLRKKSGGKLLTDEELTDVTVIVPVRNEAENIQACLSGLLQQDYPRSKLRIIVLNDYSTDPTLRLAKEFENETLTVLDLKNYFGEKGEKTPNKKKAITIGVKNSHSELVATTDGDCTHQPQWLRAMVSELLGNEKNFVTGPVLLTPAKTPLAWFQQLDVMAMNGITCATIRNGEPVMCNGANMIFKRNLFYEVEGYKGNNDVPTGDDIFLMQKIHAHEKDSIGYTLAKEAIVNTLPEKGLSRFFSQRIRWVSKSGRFISFFPKLMLLLAYLLNAMVPASFALLLYPNPYAWIVPLTFLGVKFFADMLFLLPVTHFFSRKRTLLFLPFSEILHILYVLIIGPLSITGRYKWRDRKVKQSMFA